MLEMNLFLAENGPLFAGALYAIAGAILGGASAGLLLVFRKPEPPAV
jgi:hypothetical protein